MHTNNNTVMHRHITHTTIADEMDTTNITILSECINSRGSNFDDVLNVDDIVVSVTILVGSCVDDSVGDVVGNSVGGLEILDI